MRRYYTDMTADMDTSATWVAFHESTPRTRRLFKLASRLIMQMLDEEIGPEEVATILCAPEYREESVLLGLLVADGFVMMGERQLSLDVIKSLNVRLSK